MFRKARRMHLVGIGGSGMCGIGEVLVNMGYPVSGSDLASNPATRRLKQLGADVQRGHDAARVHDADVVVVSSAVRPDNPEVLEARRLHIPVIPRAEMLAELMRIKYGIAVAGSHGKTTTTALIAEVLGAADLDPTVVIGGRLGKLRSGARLGRGELMVVEADESDGSFVKMTPTIAVVTNIDREHLDHYGDLRKIQQGFRDFLSRIPFYGAAVVCHDDPNVRAITPQVGRKLITYGLREDADLVADNVAVEGFNSTYTARIGSRKLGDVELCLPGRHSVYNSLAAIAVGLELDISFETIAAGLKNFRGVDRRLQLRGNACGAMIVDDYGHHPTEIRATLAAIREGFGRRTIVVFQPHRYSRSQALLEEFGASFKFADHVIVTEIYAAGEKPLSGLDGWVVADALVRHGHHGVVYEPDLKKVPGVLREMIEPGDLVLTLGAGDVWKAGQALLRDRPRTTRRRATARATP